MDLKFQPSLILKLDKIVKVLGIRTILVPAQNGIINVASSTCDRLCATSHTLKVWY